MAIRKSTEPPEIFDIVETVGYARVSTREQNLDLQFDALRKAGVAEGNIFVDKVAGWKSKRPGLEKTLKMLRPGWVLCVWRLDRLGRNLGNLLELTQNFHRRRIGLRSLTEHIDTTTPIGMLYFHLLGAFAQFERDIIRERSMAGSALAKERMEKEGRKWGRPPNPKMMAIIPAARTDLASGMTFPEIAKKYRFKQSTLQKAIGRKGDLMHQKKARKRKGGER